jgi:hypothetical protein
LGGAHSSGAASTGPDPDKVSREDILAHAYAQCRSNKGAQAVFYNVVLMKDMAEEVAVVKLVNELGGAQIGRCSNQLRTLR